MYAILLSKVPPPPIESISKLRPERDKAEEIPIAVPDTYSGQIGGKLLLSSLPEKPVSVVNASPADYTHSAICSMRRAPIFITNGENNGAASEGKYGNASEIIVFSPSVMRSPYTFSSGAIKPVEAELKLKPVAHISGVILFLPDKPLTCSGFCKCVSRIKFKKGLI